MAQVFAGTSGYSFKEWRGTFYPEKFPERQFLPYYAERLPTVELNNTFYRTPTPEAIAGWCANVPPSFKFSVKAPQRITHISRLKDASELLGAFAELVMGFGERLGVVLFQFPPQFRVNFERLQAFREVWPRHIPTALEFRNASWDTDEIRTWLRAERLGWVVNDSDDGEAGSEPEAMPTEPEALSTETEAMPSGPAAGALAAAIGGDVLYVRLRREQYTEVELSSWAKALAAAPTRTVYVFFKHEVRGPGYAQTLRQQLP
jgi:uncharacterized protein YecE (DUF72 family)